MKALVVMIFTQALIKTVYEILVLPLTIVVVKWVKKVEGSDIYDNKVSYNPFLISQV
jgi:uncharacterized PurR-regulated membrane protein YhhQ (DUF165 family)